MTNIPFSISKITKPDKNTQFNLFSKSYNRNENNTIPNVQSDAKEEKLKTYENYPVSTLPGIGFANYQENAGTQLNSTYVPLSESSRNQSIEFANYNFIAGDFNDADIRRDFIAKVYAILTVQLLVTAGVICAFLLIPSVTEWVKANKIAYFVSYGIFLVTYIALVCCESVRRVFPLNFLALTIFTLAFSYMTGTITAYHSVSSVLICICMTAGITFIVSMTAIMCPCDITKCGALICFLSIVLLIFGIVCSITYLVSGFNKTLHAIYGGIASILFTIYLAYDTQMIIGGRTYEISPEEYIHAALSLYMDIVQLFISILSLFNSE